MSINGTNIASDFYSSGKKYWEEIEPTLDGMLGGFSQITNVDVKASTTFLNKFYTSREKKNENESDIKEDKEELRALDCGAGIGRVTKHLLLNYFDVVDLLEQNKTFLSQAKEYIGVDKWKNGRIGETFCVGLQEFSPKADLRYDCVWLQWVIGHLTDEDFVEFLQKCKNVLKEDGMIVVKDNTTSSDECDTDTTDSSVTRPYWLLKELFQKAGLNVISEKKQKWKGLYPVHMFALR